MFDAATSNDRAFPSLITLEQCIATVRVGPEGKAFDVHKALLCHCSSYFRAAFMGSFREAKDNAITLVDTDATTFKLFMRWLYMQRLVKAPTQTLTEIAYFAGMDEGWTNRRSSSGQDSEDDECWPLDDLLDLYIFADRYDARQLKVDIMAVWQRQEIASSLLISFPIVIKAFNNLPESSPLCKYLVEYFAHYWYPNPASAHFLEYRSELPNAFLVDVLLLKSQSLNGRLTGLMSSLV